MGEHVGWIYKQKARRELQSAEKNLHHVELLRKHCREEALSTSYQEALKLQTSVNTHLDPVVAWVYQGEDCEQDEQQRSAREAVLERLAAGKQFLSLICPVLRSFYAVESKDPEGFQDTYYKAALQDCIDGELKVSLPTISKYSDRASKALMDASIAEIGEQWDSQVSSSANSQVASPDFVCDGQVFDPWAEGCSLRSGSIMSAVRFIKT